MRSRRPLALVAAACFLLAACSDDDGESESTQTTTGTEDAECTEILAEGGTVDDCERGRPTTTTEPQVLDVLVTNDDGYAAEGIAVLVEALRAEPDVQVTVVAPADDRTGTGDQTTPGGGASELVRREVETASGYPAVAVEGFPADTVNVALDVLDLRPDVIVSGINKGQNLGPVFNASGTVGAARTAGRRGLPSLAVSQGLPEPPDYELGAEYAIDWVREHRDELDDDDEPAAEPVPVENLNIPTCTAGEVRGQVEVPAVFQSEINSFEVDCTSTATGQPDDVSAFTNGYATLSSVDPG